MVLILHHRILFQKTYLLSLLRLQIPENGISENVCAMEHGCWCKPLPKTNPPKSGKKPSQWIHVVQAVCSSFAQKINVVPPSAFIDAER